jgi:hypothetical protein
MSESERLNLIRLDPTFDIRDPTYSQWIMSSNLKTYYPASYRSFNQNRCIFRIKF